VAEFWNPTGRCPSPGAVLPGLLLFPRRPHVVVVLQQLQQDVPALLVHVVFQLRGREPGRGRGPPSPAASAVNMARETANGSSGGTAGYAAIEGFLSSGPDSVSTFEPRKKGPFTVRVFLFPCVIV
jgi:hypothetical protein